MHIPQSIAPCVAGGKPCTGIEGGRLQRPLATGPSMLSRWWKWLWCSNFRVFGLTPLSEDLHGYMPPLLKNNSKVYQSLSCLALSLRRSCSNLIGTCNSNLVMISRETWIFHSFVFQLTHKCLKFRWCTTVPSWRKIFDLKIYHCTVFPFLCFSQFWIDA